MDSEHSHLFADCPLRLRAVASIEADDRQHLPKAAIAPRDSLICRSPPTRPERPVPLRSLIPPGLLPCRISELFVSNPCRVGSKSVFHSQDSPVISNAGTYPLSAIGKE